MKTDDVDGSDFQIDDRRGKKATAGKVGIPALIIVVVGFLLSQAGGGGGGAGGLEEILGQLDGQVPSGATAPANTDGTRDEQEEFVADVGTLVQDYWSDYFDSSGERFDRATVVVFDAPTDTGGCGIGEPQAGPFYCPPSQQIFIDFGFYEQLERQLGFEGDFAMAYVLAHEYGHHIQNLLGIDDEVRKAQDGASTAEANRLSVKLELQADCFAGAWAASAFADDRLETGDFDEAMDAASAVGDDAIQGQAGGRVDRESFTHGSSAERKQWFTEGFESGDPTVCDTFA